MTSRRAFLAGLAAMAAPLFARLALPRTPERKLLPCPWERSAPAEGIPRILHAGVHTDFKGGQLYMLCHDVRGKAHWVEIGEVSHGSFEFEPIQLRGATVTVESILWDE